MIFAGLGVLVGIASGLLGIGGGILLIPTLVIFFKFTQHQAQGVALAVLMIPVVGLAVYTYWKAGAVDIKVVALIASGFFLGGWLGAKLALFLPAQVLQRGFGILMIVLGVKMLWK